MALLFKQQALNNAFANHRLGLACQGLSEQELSGPCDGFFASIIATLNHILIVDWYYVSALEGACIGPSAFDESVPCPQLSDYVEAQRLVDQRLVRLCEETTLTASDRDVRLIRGDTVETDRFDRVFLHLIQHQIHHRGQVHCLLSATSVAPPQLDEFYLSWEADQALRKEDLIALGTTEADVWGGS